jgi:hypothetical protein
VHAIPIATPFVAHRHQHPHIDAVHPLLMLISMSMSRMMMLTMVMVAVAMAVMKGVWMKHTLMVWMIDDENNDVESH